MFNYHIDRELPEAKKAFTSANLDSYGVPRWISNNRVPMDDMLSCWVELGLISESQRNFSNYIRKMENEQAMEAYAREKASQEASTEEEFEMRAAFGPGAEVVDIITGRKYRT